MRLYLWMLMITVSFVLCFQTGHCAKGQSVSLALNNATPLTSGNYRFFHPKCSPDGKFLAMTSDNYQGIWVLELRTHSLRVISNEEREGYGFAWSQDSREIACRLTKNTSHKRISAIKIYELSSGIPRMISDYRQGVGLPFWADKDLRICYPRGKNLEIISSERKKRPSVGKSGFLHPRERVIFYIAGRIVVATLDLREKTMLVNPTNRFLNPQLSPNKDKICFEMTDGRIYVMNIDGSEIVDLGPGSHPRWSPNSKFLVYFIAEDDGERVITSDIYITDLQGEKKVKITDTQDRIEMHPDWSPDGHTIFYDEYDSGIIYKMPLNDQMK